VLLTTIFAPTPSIIILQPAKLKSWFTVRTPLIEKFPVALEAEPNTAVIVVGPVITLADGIVIPHCGKVTVTVTVAVEEQP
jgi:hypothetical protein